MTVMMNTVTLAATLALLAGVSGGAQSSSANKLDETPMTLTGCVVQGEDSDSFTISNMTVGGTGAALHPAGAIYRLDTTKGLKAHVNHRVEISGRADLADIDKGSVETKTNSAGQVETSVNSERRTVTSKGAAVAVGTAGTAGSTKETVNTYKFMVGTIKMLSSSCS